MHRTKRVWHFQISAEEGTTEPRELSLGATTEMAASKDEDEGLPVSKQQQVEQEKIYEEETQVVNDDDNQKERDAAVPEFKEQENRTIPGFEGTMTKIEQDSNNKGETVP